MASIIKVDTIQDQDGNNIINENANTVTIGKSGDTITIPSGATFASVGIDDNATSTAITIDSSNNVEIGTATFTSDTLFSTRATFGTIAQFTGSNGILRITNPSTNNINLELGSADTLNIQTTSTGTAFRINSVGDVSFYEDTGTTAKLFWDASAESLGIGTSTPTAPLTVIGGNNSTQMIIGGAVGTTDRGLRIATDVFSGNNDIAVLDAQHTSGTLVFQTVSSERMRIDSSGNVGIGTSSPSCKLQTNYVSTTAYSTTISDGGGYLAGANDGLDIENGNSTVSNAFSSLHFRASGTAGNAAGRIILGNPGAANSFFAFQLRDSSHIGSTQEKMRIDSSGNVGIGTSSPQEKLDIDGNIAISGNTLFEEVTSTAGMPSSAGNKSVNTNYDSTFSLTAGKWLILVNASLQVFQTSGNESGLYLLSLSLGSSAGADDYGLIQKAVLKWGNGSNSYGDNSGGHFPTLTLGSTTTLHTRWTVTEYGTASNFWVRGNLTRIRCIRIG